VQYKLPGTQPQDWSSRATTSRLGDESPRVTNANEVIEEDAEVLLLETQGLTQKLLQSSL
jgi:serine/threonine protein phosphatase PrpC